MFELSITPLQLTSSLFLNKLLDDPHFDTFGFAQDRLISNSQYDNFAPSSINSRGFITQGEHSSLVIFAEGLSLEKVFSACSALSDHLNVLYFQLIRMPQLTGCAIVVKVQRKDELDLRCVLEKVAKEHFVELCLVDQCPSLAKPGLLIMDMDSTAIGVECIDEIAILAGVGEAVSQVTEQAMQGKLDFSESLRSRVHCLAGADEEILSQVRRALPLMPGVCNLVKVLKSYNWRVAIASGGFAYFAEHLGARLELDATVANQLSIVDGKLSGEVLGDIIDGQVKASTLTELAARWGISAQQTVAMGDGANDLPMMKAAALGVAFHAKPVVRQQADISIRGGALDSLLWVLAANK